MSKVTEIVERYYMVCGQRFERKEEAEAFERFRPSVSEMDEVMECRDRTWNAIYTDPQEKRVRTFRYLLDCVDNLKKMSKHFNLDEANDE